MIEVQTDNVWIISGHQVLITSTTTIDESDGPAVVGAYVKVEGYWDETETYVIAVEIEVKDAREVRITFEGVIETQSDTLWVVAGREVLVTTDTEIDEEHGRAVVGARVEVKGIMRVDGRIEARRIKVLESPVVPTPTREPRRMVTFRGFIEEQRTDVWVIGGREVYITADTVIDEEDGPATVGALVEVTAYRDGDRLIARAIEVERAASAVPVTFRDEIERMSDTTWVVGDYVVHLTADTEIENADRAQVGALAVVRGFLQRDGSVIAREIVVLGQPTERRLQVEFRGVIESFSDTTWVIGGYTVTVTTSTRIVGTPEVGAVAEVHARVQDDTLVATRIKVLPRQVTSNRVEFTGIVEEIQDNAIVVSGHVVRITDTTFIDESRGLLDVGVQVEVKGIRQADGTIEAIVVEVED